MIALCVSEIGFALKYTAYFSHVKYFYLLSMRYHMVKVGRIVVLLNPLLPA